MDYSEVTKKVKSSIAFITTKTSRGTGFVFWKKNILVTCDHVIRGSKKVFIQFPDSKAIDAEVILCDEEHDLALLKFNDDTKEPLVLAEHPTVKEGMPVIFSGYPLGLKDLTTHHGIISAITKDPIGITKYLIDGTVNRGNSGCPLMNTEGMVIGVVNAMKLTGLKTLSKIEEMKTGAISLYNADVVELLNAILDNLQLGVGSAVPASYIPKHKVIKNNNDKTND